MIFVTRPVCAQPRISAAADGGPDDAWRHRVRVGSAGAARDVRVSVSLYSSTVTAVYEVSVSSASRFSAPGDPRSAEPHATAHGFDPCIEPRRPMPLARRRCHGASKLTMR